MGYRHKIIDRKGGFTIIELVMVIVLIAIMAALAIPKFDSYYAIKLGGAARKLLFDIRYAQRLAIAQHDSYGVEFNTAANTYRIYKVSDNSTAIEPLSRSSFLVDYTANTEFKDIDITSVNFGGTTKIAFSSLGVPKNGSGVDLSVNGTVTISYKGSSQTITVIPNTGKASL